MYKGIETMNMSAGLQVPFIYVNEITGGLFVNLLLVAIFTIFAMGSYFIQKRSIGTGDFPMSLAVAGFVTTTFAFIMRLIPGLVSGESLACCLIATGLFVLMFLFSRD